MNGYLIYNESPRDAHIKYYYLLLSYSMVTVLFTQESKHNFVSLAQLYVKFR